MITKGVNIHDLVAKFNLLDDESKTMVFCYLCGAVGEKHWEVLNKEILWWQGMGREIFD